MTMATLLSQRQRISQAKMQCWMCQCCFSYWYHQWRVCSEVEDYGIWTYGHQKLVYAPFFLAEGTILGSFSVFMQKYSFRMRGPDSSVGIATDYGLDGPRSNPGGDEIFPPVQTGPGSHPASCKMGTRSFPGQGVMLNTHPPSSAAVMEQQSYTSTQPLGHTGPVTGSLYLYLYDDNSTAIPLPTLWATPGL